MDWSKTVFELIDMRSFSNLWYWIVLAATWSSASYFIIGVPYSMVVRARRHGGQAEADLETLTALRLRRIATIRGTRGAIAFGMASFILTTLGLLGFYYRVEFCQAVFLIGLPLSFVGLLTLRTARKIEAREAKGEALRRILMIHRFWVQALGMVAIFVTVFWGMYQNLSIGALGG